MAAFEFAPELSPEEEAQIDRLVETGVENPHDALKKVLLGRRARETKLGSQSVSRTISPAENDKETKKPKSRRWRAPGIQRPDSYYDPHWNVSRNDANDQPADPEEDERIAAIKAQMAKDAQATEIRRLMDAGLSETQAIARVRARKEIRSRPA